MVQCQEPNGGTYIKYELQRIQEKLASEADKEVTMQLIKCCSTALNIVDCMISMAGSVGRSDTSLDQYKPKVNQLEAKLQGIATACNLLLQQPGITAKGLATPVPPTNANPSITVRCPCYRLPRIDLPKHHSTCHWRTHDSKLEVSSHTSFS
jgi:hypothetical protein